MTDVCTLCPLHEYHVNEKDWEQYHHKPVKLNKNEGAYTSLTVLLTAPMFKTRDRLIDLKKLLKKHYPDFNKVQVYVIFAVNCNYPPETELPDTCLLKCQPNLQAQLERIAASHEENILLTSGAKVLKPLKRLNFGFSDKGKTSLHFNRRVRHRKNPYGFEVFCTVSFNRKTVGTSDEAVWSSDLQFMRICMTGEYEVKKYRYKIIRTREEVKRLYGILQSELQKKGSINLSVDTETNKLHVFGKNQKLKLLTVQISFRPGVGFVIPIDHKDMDDYRDTRDVREKIVKWILYHKSIHKISHNGMFDYRVFYLMKYPIRAWDWDTILLHHLFQSDDRHDLGYVGKFFTFYGDYDSELEHYKTDHPEADPQRGGSYANVPLEILAKYGAGDAVVTFELLPILVGLVSELGLFDFYWNHVRRAQIAFIYMSCVGMRLDLDLLDKYYVEYGRAMNKFFDEEIATRREVRDWEAAQPENQIWAKFSSDPESWWAANPRKRKPPEYKHFNPKSPKQLADLFENYCGIPVLSRSKKTREASYDRDVREYLMKYPEKNNQWGCDLSIIKPIHTYVLQKHEFSNFIKKFVEDDLVDEYGRVHSSFKLFGAKTGRSSSADPNMQQIPSRAILLPPFKIKKLFRPPKGYSIIQLDFSQMELRVLASVAEDKAMLSAFAAGVDIHRQTGSRLFGKPVEEVEDIERSAGKTINFGLVYGMSAETLAVDYYKALDGDEKKAEQMYLSLRGENETE